MNEVQAQLARFVVIHDEAMAVAAVLWIAFAWVHEIAVHSPLLKFTGADADIGKTTACGVLKFLTPRAYAGAELTGPVLYRFVDHVHPTLIIDDADRLLRRRADLVHIINIGWTRGTLIPRQDHGVTRWFDPFCPKVLAGVDLLLPKATETRTITIRLLPKLPEEKLEEFNHVDDDSFVTLRRKFARWAADNAAALKNAIDYLFLEWNNKAAGFVGYGRAGGVRAVEQLRLVMAELMVATVRAQVMFSLFTDFEKFTTFKPDPRHEQEVHTMLDQLVSWARALRTVRT